MFIIKLLSQHVSGIIMPIIRRTRVCTAAYGVCSALVVVAVVVWSYSNFHSAQLASQLHTTTSYHNQCRTPYAAVNTLVLLMMGIMMPETC